MEKINTVSSLKSVPFPRRTQQHKLLLKELGPDRPDIVIKQQTQDRGRSYTRTFSRTWYEKKVWLTGCAQSNALFCFPCLLFQLPGTDPAWIRTGITDISHFPEKARNHELTRSHLENALHLVMFGNVNIATQLEEGYREGVRQHNQEVDRNRHFLSKMIDCIKFCGAFDLALHGHDERESPGIFMGLVDFVGSLDAAVHEHLQSATVFKGTSKTVQNELLDCMFSVVREQIIDEVKSADFVSIQADETMDVSTQCQLVIVVRYIDKSHNVQERFFELVPLQNAKADSVATTLLDRLSTIIPADHKAKLISQTYDGASVMGGATGGVQKKVQDVYENAHYVHCYAHQLNLIMQQATSHLSKVRLFFSEIAGFSGFFSRCPRRTSVLNNVAAHRVPRPRWNFHSRAVNTVYEHKDDLLTCFETIWESGDFDPATVREAGGFVRMLEDETFNFFLKLFHHIMPHVDVLYSQLQKPSIDSVFVNRVLQVFTNNVQKIRESLSGLHAHDGSEQQQQAKRCRTTIPDELQTLASEVCDTILIHAKERFAFTKHLISATLLQGDTFGRYSRVFPDEAVDTAAEAYPVLNKNKLKAELSVIYDNEEFTNCTGAVALFQLIVHNNLQDVFSETLALLKILITTPMTTAEAERCFSTLKRINTFLGNAVSQDRLNALAMLSIEKRLVRDMPNFNKRVIEKFASLKERRATFTYK